MCAWIYPKWVRWSKYQLNFLSDSNRFVIFSGDDQFGIFNIRTPETLESPNFVGVLLTFDENGILSVWSMDVHKFRFNHSVPFENVLRKWSRLCISYDFQENEAQVICKNTIFKEFAKQYLINVSLLRVINLIHG